MKFKVNIRHGESEGKAEHVVVYICARTTAIAVPVPLIVCSEVRVTVIVFRDGRRS